MSSGRLQDVVNTCFPRRMFAEPGVFHIILEQLLSRIILGSCFWRVNRGQNGLQWPLRFQLFTFSRAVFISHEKSFSTNLRIAESFNFVKSVQIQSFFWSVFSRIRTAGMREKTAQKKYPYLDPFHAVINLHYVIQLVAIREIIKVATEWQSSMCKRACYNAISQ